MNTSTKAKFKDLLQDDKKITVETFVEQQAIKYDIFMNAASLEVSDKTAAEEVIAAIINNQASATANTAKCHKPTVPNVTPTTNNNQPIFDNHTKKRGKPLFPDDITATEHAFINKPANKMRTSTERKTPPTTKPSPL